MKNQLKWATLGCAFALATPGLTAEGQVDYSKCRDFLTPSQESLSGGFNSNPAGYLPFDINEDGSIQPHQDIVSYEQDKDGGVEVITYKVPNYIAGIHSAPIPGGGGFYGGSGSEQNSEKRNPYTANLRNVEVRIERDEQGQLARIITDNNFSTGELTRLQKQGTQAYLNGLNEQQRKNIEKLNGEEEFQLPLHQRVGSEISLKIQNGQCVPVEQDERYLVEAKPDGESVDRTLYNTELCHDIDDFLNEHPETAACFNPDLNKKMSDIFKNYYEPPKNFPGFGGGVDGISFGGAGGFGVGMGSDMVSGMGGLGGLYSSPDLNTEIMPYALRQNSDDQEMMQRFDRSAGRSPVISSHMILQRCYNMGLGSFIDDPTLWEAAGVAASSAESEEESSSSSR